MNAHRGIIAIMGSGETTDSMVRVHRYLLDRLSPPIQAAFIDTPAGFQMNADDLYDKTREYFHKRFNLAIEQTALKSAKNISPSDREKAFQILRQANYIFVGPGSPTYALKNWLGTPLPQILFERIQAGGCFVAASAAALTLGRFTLPVYEIYKVGEDLYWAEGLDLLGRFGLDLVVIPHWNNAEGGTHDTRFCYMGEPRLLRLQAMLPRETSFLGIDEHTACILDFHSGQVLIKGVGTVTLLRGQTRNTFRDGETLPLGEFQSLSASLAASPARVPAPSLTSPPPLEPLEEQVEALKRNFDLLLKEKKGAALVDVLIQLDKLIWKSFQEFEDEEKVSQAREKFRSMIVHLGLSLDECPKDVSTVLAPLMNILLGVRTQLRSAKQWALADEMRGQLVRSGIIVEDTPRGPQWRIKS
jgi:peptidase E